MKNLKAIFFIFVFIQGIIYLFLIPPWQSPDETHHFGYGVLLSKNAKLCSKEHKNISREIMESMVTFHSWKYTNLDRPDPLPILLGGLPFYHGIGSLYTGRAPLYHLTVSLIIKKLKIKETIIQFYIFRLFSFFLFMFTVYFTYLSANLVFKDNIGYTLAGVCLAGLLPQFVIISNSINQVVAVILLMSIFLYIIFYSLYKEKNLGALLFGPLLITLGLYTHRAALFMIPPFLVYLLILFIKSLKEKSKLIKYLAVVSVLLVLIIGVYFISSYILPDSFLEKVSRESGVKTLLSELNRFIHYFTNGISKDTSRSVFQFMDGFFKSFWYFAGWLRFGYLVDIYSILKLIYIFSVIGIIKYICSYIRRREISIDFRSFLILAAIVLPIILGTLIHCFPKYHIAQGRYLFPAISALGILFVMGLKEIAPKRLERWVPIFIIFGFILLDIYTLFHPLMRVFYFFRNM